MGFFACCVKWQYLYDVIFLKNEGCSFGTVLAFVHLLCVHIVLKTYFNIPFFLSLSQALQFSVLPSIYQSQLTNPHLLQNARMMSRRYWNFAQHTKTYIFILLSISFQIRSGIHTTVWEIKKLVHFNKEDIILQLSKTDR